ncbi:hypothetical protein ACFQ38_11435 [Sporosarcina contaminans]|uniref:DUF4352 domain-containing protein n=1 Tax=Sporosarcina contaminans TaxID=633403 RepID=A0ABW3TZ72_9BACL
MDAIFSVLGGLFTLVFLVFLIITILQFAKKNKAKGKKSLLFLGVSFMLMVIFASLAPETEPKQTSESNDKPKVEIERDQQDEKNSDVTTRTENNKTKVTVTKNEEVKKEPVAKKPNEEIQDAVKQVINSDLADKKVTTISLDVNKNYGLDDGSYIVLPKLKWDVKNSSKTTKEMLEMYSDHIAAKLADQKDVSEITVFWEVPHHLEGDIIAKFMYNRSGDSMAKTDNWFAPLLN